MRITILAMCLVLAGCGSDSISDTALTANESDNLNNLQTPPNVTNGDTDESTVNPVADPADAVEPVADEPVDVTDPVDSSVEPDFLRCDDVGTFPVGFNPSAGVPCRLDLVISAEVADNGFGQVLALETDPIPFENMLDVPLECKRLFESYFCNCDNSYTDLLADAQERGKIFFTATLRNLNQIDMIAGRDGDFDTFTIEGSWTDDFRNTVPLYRMTGDTGTTLLHLPPPGFVRPILPGLSYRSNAVGDIFISQFSSSSTGDDTTIVSQCVVQ